MAVKFIQYPPMKRMIDRPFLQRIGMAMKSARTIISGIDPSTQYSALQPLTPFQPELIGRQWDFPVGYNINYIPRGYQTGLTPFAELRNLARNCEILRLGIETCIDQICTFDWSFVPKEDSNIQPDDPRITEITEFFKSPDKVNTFSQWIGAIVEELLVTDAVSIYRPKTRKGMPYAFELLDGVTIFPLITDEGRRPVAPNPAYQQIIKGTPKTDYDTTELLYYPKKVRVYTPYGFSAVEQIIMTARKSINRDIYQLSYFTAGSVPDAFAEMPEGMTPDQIATFSDRFNNLLTGNAQQRKQIPFLPAGAKINQLKEPILSDAFDEWMARLVMFALSLPPNAFVKQQNRATAESEKDRALQEGQAPRLQYIKGLLDSLIADFGPEYAANIEAVPKDNANQDPTVTANNSKTYVAAGIKTINECRADIGLDPMEGGNELMALTPTGYVPLDSFEQTQQMQQKNMDAQAKAKTDAKNNQTGTPDQSAPAKDVASKNLEKNATRIIVRPPVGEDGLFIQPKDQSPEREMMETHNRERFANHFKYADLWQGNTRTYDPKGNYLCYDCNQINTPKCLLVSVKKIDAKAPSCGDWEDKCGGDPEMPLGLKTPEIAGYAIAENGEGWGCHRCPFASKAYEADSRGRDLYCGKGDFRVLKTACCNLNGAKEVPIDADGMPTDAEKTAYSRLRKAVRHEPIPFAGLQPPEQRQT